MRRPECEARATHHSRDTPRIRASPARRRYVEDTAGTAALVPLGNDVDGHGASGLKRAEGVGVGFGEDFGGVGSVGRGLGASGAALLALDAAFGARGALATAATGAALGAAETATVVSGGTVTVAGGGTAMTLGAADDADGDETSPAADGVPGFGRMTKNAPELAAVNCDTGPNPPVEKSLTSTVPAAVPSLL